MKINILSCCATRQSHCRIYSKSLSVQLKRTALVCMKSVSDFWCPCSDLCARPWEIGQINKQMLLATGSWSWLWHVSQLQGEAIHINTILYILTWWHYGWSFERSWWSLPLQCAVWSLPCLLFRCPSSVKIFIQYPALSLCKSNI